MKKQMLFALGCLLLLSLACQFISFSLGAEQTCYTDSEQWNFLQFDSPFISEEIVIDGQISSKPEWADAFCMDILMFEWGNIQNGDIRNARWWVQNDEQDIYFLVRVEKYPWLKGVAVNYFWPKYTGTWEHSDGAYIGVNGYYQDSANWDETHWYDDLEMSPPGTLDMAAATSEDDVYYWFEIKKSLDSGDSYDWALEPEDAIGNSSHDSFLFALIVNDVAYTRNLQMWLGTP